TTLPSIMIGTPPCRATAPGKASADTRPFFTWSSNTLLGRRKIAAVRGLGMPASTPATRGSSSPPSTSRYPPSSTTAITTVAPRFLASASDAAAIFLAASSVSTCFVGSCARAPRAATATRISDGKILLVFMLPPSKNQSTDINRVVEKLPTHVFKPVRRVVRNDNHVALPQLPHIAAVDP